MLFKDYDAGRKIFERWRERFGRIDKKEAIYLAIVRSFSTENPAHYHVLITSSLRPEEESSARRKIMIACRMNTMHAESDVNLSHFLEAYKRAGSYLLLPAFWKGTGEPELLSDIAIQKRKLSVKVASEIGPNDIEAIALRLSRDTQK